MPTVNRESFLHCLESIQPGLSTRDILEQSSCFAFQNGRIRTFNDETACSIPSPLGKEASGAVPSAKLLDLLRKATCDEIDVEIVGNEFQITGKGEKWGLAMESEVTLPRPDEKATSWRTLPEGFGEAIKRAQQCASTDESRFDLTCVHVHPKWIEALDGMQAVRWKLKTGVEKPFLVRKSSVKHVSNLGVSEIGETETWCHFKRADGMVLSIRRYVEDYPEITHLFAAEGHPATLPKALTETAVKAMDFSKDEDDGVIQVKLTPGKKAKIRGQSVKGWYEGRNSVKYAGEPMEFMIAPQILIDILKDHSDCIICPDRLKVNGGAWTYVSFLAPPDNGREDSEEGGEEQ